MAIELLFGRKSPGKIGNLELDAMINERQKYANNVTTFPIEDGSIISDHVIRMPEEVEIEGFVTNTPIEYIQGLRTSADDDRVLNAYLMLLEIAGYAFPNQAYRFNKLETISETEQPNDFQLIDILTSLRIYTSMALVNLDIPRDAKTGDTIKFTASFRRVNITKTNEVQRNPDKISENNPSADRAKKQDANTVDQGKTGTLQSVADKFFVKIGAIEAPPR